VARCVPAVVSVQELLAYRGQHAGVAGHLRPSQHAGAVQEIRSGSLCTSYIVSACRSGSLCTLSVQEWLAVYQLLVSMQEWRVGYVTDQHAGVARCVAIYQLVSMQEWLAVYQLYSLSVQEWLAVYPQRAGVACCVPATSQHAGVARRLRN
jgi:nitroreductase